MSIKLIFFLALIHYGTAKTSQFLLTDEEKIFINHAEEARAQQRPECCPVDKFPVDLRPNNTEYKQYLEEKCKTFNQLQNCPCEEYNLACANIDDFLKVTDCMEKNEEEANNTCFKKDYKDIDSADLCKQSHPHDNSLMCNATRQIYKTPVDQLDPISPSANGTEPVEPDLEHSEKQKSKALVTSCQTYLVFAAIFLCF